LVKTQNDVLKILEPVLFLHGNRVRKPMHICRGFESACCTSGLSFLVDGPDILDSVPCRLVLNIQRWQSLFVDCTRKKRALRQLSHHLSVVALQLQNMKLRFAAMDANGGLRRTILERPFTPIDSRSADLTTLCRTLLTPAIKPLTLNFFISSF
jgi:hypothetical protein